jgi:hypothetical protein
MLNFLTDFGKLTVFRKCVCNHTAVHVCGRVGLDKHPSVCNSTSYVNYETWPLGIVEVMGPFEVTKGTPAHTALPLASVASSGATTS